MSAQIITLRPELAPLQGKVLDRPDIRYLDIRATLDSCDVAEKNIEDEMNELRVQERYIRDRFLDLFRQRGNVRAKRNECEREMDELLQKFPDCGEG